MGQPRFFVMLGGVCPEDLIDRATTHGEVVRVALHPGASVAVYGAAEVVMPAAEERSTP